MHPLLRLWMKGAAIVLLCCVFTWHVHETNKLSMLPEVSSTHGFPHRELHGDADVRDAEVPEQYVRPALKLPPLRLGGDAAKSEAPAATYAGSEGRSSSIEASAIVRVTSPSASHVVSVSQSTSPLPPSPSPTPAPSTSPALDVETLMLAVSTRKYVHERYRLYGESRKNWFNQTKRAANNQTSVGFATLMSEVNLDQFWKGSFLRTVNGNSTFLLPCSALDPLCKNMTANTLVNRFDLLYQPARFYPTMASALSLFSTKTVLKSLVKAYNSSDDESVKRLRRGQNVRPPYVAVAFNAFVTKQGSVLTEDVLAPLWPDSTKVEGFLKDHQLIQILSPPNQTLNATQTSVPPAPIEWRRVKELVVISHLHQGMPWHALVSEFYRIFALLPYIQAHQDIFVHVTGMKGGIQEKLFPAFGIPRERLLFDQHIRADIVYYTQFIDRNDIPSLGLTYLINQRLLHNFGVPSERRYGVLATEGISRQPILRNERSDDGDIVYEINIVCIVRNNPVRGRMIINYPELKSGLVNLSLSYDAKLQRSVSERNDTQAKRSRVKINLLEHLSTMATADCLKLYSKADIVIGPHGAGFVNLFAVPPGGHVIELITARHLNLFSTSRLGLTYHGIVSPLTSRGIVGNNTSLFNYEPDVQMLIGLVESILDARFLPAP